MQIRNWRNVVVVFFALVFILGITLRFCHITRNDFIFYDEGYYLNQNRFFLDALVRDFPSQFSLILKALEILLMCSLHSAKGLWIFWSDLRVFWGGYGDWFFPRLISAICGTLVIPVVFIFARRLFNSWIVGLLSAAVMAIMPSAVFYSRLGLQESATTLFCLLGFYFYIFSKKLGGKMVCSAIFFALATLMNYRLIVLPAQVLACELYFLAVTKQDRPPVRKYVWHALAYLTFIVFIGSLFDGVNAVNVFGWIFYQSQMAKTVFDGANFLSYPYYVLTLQNFFLSLLFIGNIIYIFRKQWLWLLPFAIVVAHTLLFSFAAEQGMRYLCVVMPFRAMAAASLLYYLWRESPRLAPRIFVGGFGLLLFISCGLESVQIAKSSSDYRSSIEYLKTIDPRPKAIATQAYIENLYTQNRLDVIPCPDSFALITLAYNKGYRYLILDPQAYISWTADGKRFSQKLEGPLEFIRQYVQPIKIFDNFDDKLLRRFAFEHNEDLRKTLDFLNNRKEHFGQIRIYALKDILDKVQDHSH